MTLSLHTLWQCRHTYQVVVSGSAVLDGGKPAQPVLVDVHPQRITGGDQHIHTEIKLEAVNDEWLEREMPQREANCHRWPNQTHL